MKHMDVFCNMYGKRLLVGRLASVSGGILFQYAERFLDSGLLLSPFKLPLQPGVFEDERKTFDGLHGLFNDSLPDGWGLLLLDRKLKGSGANLQELSPLDRLALVGTRGMGALEYEPEDFRAGPDEEFLDLDGLAEKSRQILDDGGSLEAVNTLLRLGGSSGGARPKILCDVRQSDLTIKASGAGPGFEPWMIKFRAKEDPSDIGLIEYAYSVAAKEAGVEMPDTCLFPSNISEGFFGIKRFDRTNGMKIHTHTACGLLHANHRYPSLTYEGLITLSQALTKDHRETEKMIRLMVFNVKAGNMDDHSKNFSFLMDADGQWKMAPAYDLTPSKGLGGEHSTTVNGKGKNITDTDLMTAAANFTSETNVKKMIADVENALQRIPKIMKEARAKTFVSTNAQPEN
jgi:serine/threonine-protein kinase HipA